MQFQAVIDEIRHDIIQRFDSFEGQVANYIPALARVNPEQFGMAVYTTEGASYCTGEAHVPFSIQSVSKVLTLTLAIQRYGDQLWTRVAKEPSGTAFNSLTQLEFESGIPRNPLINAGAIVVCDALFSRLSAPTHTMIETIRQLSGNPKLAINQEVSRSEFENRYRNAAMANLMKSFGNFDNDVEQVLKTYFGYCAIEMNCIEMAQCFGYLANQGVQIESGKRVLSARQNSQLNALLFTSGLYDAAGDFAYRVGMPGKSGVGGAIFAVLPGKFTVVVWSPKLNAYGNSSAGLYALQQLAEKLELTLF